MSRAVMAALAALLAIASCIYPFPSQEQHYYGAEQCPPESEEPEAPGDTDEAPGNPGAGLMMLLPDGRDSATAQPLTAPLPMQCAKCDRVVIRLPDRIEFHGNRKQLKLGVCTRLPPGRYRIRYLPSSDTFEIAPQDGAPGFGRDQQVLEIFLEDRPQTRRLYQAYQRSMKRYVPLEVHGKHTPEVVCPLAMAAVKGRSGKGGRGSGKGKPEEYRLSGILPRKRCSNCFEAC